MKCVGLHYIRSKCLNRIIIFISSYAPLLYCSNIRIAIQPLTFFFSILNTICSLTRAYIYNTTAKEYLCTLLRANCAINLTQLMHFLSRKLRQLLLSIVNSSLVVYIGAIIIFWLRSPRYFIDFEKSDFFFGQFFLEYF